MVRHKPNNFTFKFKHTPIPTYFLFVQSRHDTVPYVPSTSTSPQSRMSLSLLSCSRRACNCNGVMVHRISSNHKCKCKRAPIATYFLFAQWPITRYRSIYSININIDTEKCVIAILVYLNSRQVCNCGRFMVHHASSNKFSEFKHASIPTHLLFVQNQRNTVSYIYFITMTASAEPYGIAVVFQ